MCRMYASTHNSIALTMAFVCLMPHWDIFLPNSLCIVCTDADEMQTPVPTKQWPNDKIVKKKKKKNACVCMQFQCVQYSMVVTTLYWLRIRLDGTQTECTRCHKFVTTTEKNAQFGMRCRNYDRDTCALLYYPVTCTSRENFISAFRIHNDILLLSDSSSFFVLSSSVPPSPLASSSSVDYIKFADEWNDTFLFYCLFGELSMLWHIVHKCILKSVRSLPSINFAPDKIDRKC